MELKSTPSSKSIPSKSSNHYLKQQLEQRQIQNRSINNNNFIENNKYSYNDIITLKDGREGKIILSTPTGTHNVLLKIENIGTVNQIMAHLLNVIIYRE